MPRLWSKLMSLYKRTWTYSTLNNWNNWNLVWYLSCFDILMPGVWEQQHRADCGEAGEHAAVAEYPSERGRLRGAQAAAGGTQEPSGGYRESTPCAGLHVRLYRCVLFWPVMLRSYLMDFQFDPPKQIWFHAIYFLVSRGASNIGEVLLLPLFIYFYLDFTINIMPARMFYDFFCNTFNNVIMQI